MARRGTQHEVDVKFQVARITLRRNIGEPPLASGVIGGHPLDCKPIAGADGLDRLLDLRTLGKHRLPVDVANVVEIDIHRQAWHLIVKEVERGTALQGDPRFQERVAVQSIEKRHQAEDLFERFRAETGRGGFTGQRLRGQIHVTSAQVRLSTRSGTTRFHRVSSLPGSRLLRSRYIG